MEIVRSDRPSGRERAEKVRPQSSRETAVPTVGAVIHALNTSELAPPTGLPALPTVRLGRVLALREAIARGDYDTEEKLRVVVDRFLSREITD